jgi:hypothetical protein
MFQNPPNHNNNIKKKRDLRKTEKIISLKEPSFAIMACFKIESINA